MRSREEREDVVERDHVFAGGEESEDPGDGEEREEDEKDVESVPHVAVVRFDVFVVRRATGAHRQHEHDDVE